MPDDITTTGQQSAVYVDNTARVYDLVIQRVPDNQICNIINISEQELEEVKQAIRKKLRESWSKVQPQDVFIDVVAALDRQIFEMHLAITAMKEYISSRSSTVGDGKTLQKVTGGNIPPGELYRLYTAMAVHRKMIMQCETAKLKVVTELAPPAPHSEIDDQSYESRVKRLRKERGIDEIIGD